MSIDLDHPLHRGDADDRAYAFHSLTFLEDGDEVTVGRPDTEQYAVIPADGAALLRRLIGGEPAGRAAAWYEESYGERVEVAEFVDSLRGLGFVRDDPGPAEDPASAPEPGRNHVRWQRLGSVLYSRPAAVLYGCVLLAAIVVTVRNPELAPRHRHVFFSPSLLVCELSLFAIQWPLVLLHELSHVLAGRRLGLPTKVRISRRLHFLVFETVMNGLVSVPRGRRYLPMLAGMLTDLLVVAVCTLLAWWLGRILDPTSWVPGLMLAVAFTTLLRIAWQFYLFLRTDLYYLVTTVLGCVDLHGVTRQVLANRAYRVLGRHDLLVDEDDWHPRDRRAARWYAPLVVGGYTLSILLLVLVMVPLTWTFLSTSVARAFLGQATSTAQLWDSAVILALTGIQLLVAAVLFLRDGRESALARWRRLREVLRRPDRPDTPGPTPTPATQES